MEYTRDDSDNVLTVSSHTGKVLKANDDEEIARDIFAGTVFGSIIEKNCVKIVTKTIFVPDGVDGNMVGHTVVGTEQVLKIVGSYIELDAADIATNDIVLHPRRH